MAALPPWPALLLELLALLPLFRSLRRALRGPQHWSPRANRQRCLQKRPCLYCWVVAQASGYERRLLDFQASARTGIFGCELRQVYSNASFALGDGGSTVDMGISLVARKGALLSGRFALNTDIIVRAWRRVIAADMWRESAWTVKLDADSVFIAKRLRRLVSGLPEGWLANHEYRDGEVTLWGSLIVLSRGAVAALDLASCEDLRRAAMAPPIWDAEKKTFRARDKYHSFGEDRFLAKCLRKLKVREDRSLLRQLLLPRRASVEHCGKDFVVYHSFKEVESYRACLARTKRSRRP